MRTLGRWKNNWRSIIRDFLSIIGFIFLIVEIVDYFFPSISTDLNIPNYGILIGASSFFIAIAKNFPKQSFKMKIRDRDSFITLKIGDAFKNNGALIIPINDYFDVSLNGNVNKSNSLQKRLIADYYESKSEHLIEDIKKTTDITEAPFHAGKVVEVEQKGKRFYLTVNSKKTENNRVKSTLEDFLDALNGIYEFLSSNASRDECVTIPLLSTQHGRNANLTRDVVIRQIIDTFIETTKHDSVCEELVISIHPTDIGKGNLDFDKLCNYLEFQCNNYKDIQFKEKPEGTPIEEPSTISDIS